MAYIQGLNHTLGMVGDQHFQKWWVSFVGQKFKKHHVGLLFNLTIGNARLSVGTHRYGVAVGFPGGSLQNTVSVTQNIELLCPVFVSFYTGQRTKIPDIPVK